MKYSHKFCHDSSFHFSFPHIQLTKDITMTPEHSPNATLILSALSRLEQVAQHMHVSPVGG